MSQKQFLTPERVEQLNSVSKEARIKVLQMIHKAGSGHPAGSLGMTEVFIALYFEVLSLQPNKPNWKKRDFLILSNGHICPILYVILNLRGFFPAIELNSLRRLDSRLQGHPHLGTLPGVENTSGPLGQGVSQAAGLALALKRDNKSNHVFCIMSDGEQQEGQVWEAYQFINKYHLDNFTGIIDRNLIQIEGNTEDVMPLENLAEKISSFGLEVLQVNGHDIEKLVPLLQVTKNNSKPTVIIANTVPGKGVSFMEGKVEWHGRSPNDIELSEALLELYDS